MAERGSSVLKQKGTEFYSRNEYKKGVSSRDFGRSAFLQVFLIS
jgi:hypothetical protein